MNALPGRAAACVWPLACRLGEGLVWDAAKQSMFFVDIRGPAVHAYTPAKAAQRSWPMPEPIGWLVARASGDWVAGFRSGVAALKLGQPSKIGWLHRLHKPNSPMRLNDAKADAHGRLWFGTMTGEDDTQPVGNFYRVDLDGQLSTVDRGYRVTNGPTFSADGRTLFHTDSPLRTIYAFDLSADGGLSNKRVWLLFGDDEGYPDGMTTDGDGHVWVAHWGGARVTQRDGGGRVLQTIAVPAPHVTNVAFGGPGLNDLYITTARSGLSPPQLAAAPLSGGLFCARDAGRGCLPGVFAG
jgi:sugar lactone lactonase YvrE